MINRKRLTKKIWVDNELWNLKDVIQPTPHDDYLLLWKKREDTFHQDGTSPIEVICIDCHNDEFYPNTKEIRQAMDEIKRARDSYIETVRGYKRVLTNTWLDMVNHD